MNPSTNRLPLLVIIGVALAANALLWLPAPYLIQALAVWALTVALPGWLVVELLVGQGDARPSPGEHILYAIGAGYGVAVVVTLLLSYLPGPLPAAYATAAFNTLLFVLIAAAWLVSPRAFTPYPLPPTPLLFALLAVFAVGGTLRLANLGYAEFHGDEARAVLRAAAVIQGYDDVLFLHKKGPAEILLPTTLFALAGRVTESTARLAFALAGISALGTVYLLGKRLFGAVAGWAAAMLLAVDGYLVAFSRIVQYQSIVVLTSALVILTLVRLWQRPAGHTRYLILAAILLATGLLAHYEAALVAIPALFLVGVSWARHVEQRRGLARGLGWAVAAGTLLLALFYLPFLRHPQFGSTWAYLTERRIGGGFYYDNLADFFTRTTLYNSTYYVVFLIALTLIGLVMLYRRSLGPRWGSVAGALVVASLALVAWQPEWLSVGGRNLTVLVFVLAFGLAWVLPGVPVEERMLWLWFGAPFVLALFFVEKPRTHVYIFFTPWALLAGMVIGRGQLRLERRAGPRIARIAGAAVAAGLVVIFGWYLFRMFAYTQVEVLRTWQQNWPAGYWTAWETLDNRALFGFPLRNGWKVAGQLYAEGEIAGPYSTNEVEFWAPAWYTRGQLRCEDRAGWFFEIENPQPDPAGYARTIEEYVAKRFSPWGQALVNGEPRLRIHRRGQGTHDLRSFPLAEYAPAFDAAATADLPLGYPVVEPPITHPLDANFGDLIRLEGYDLAYDTPLGPGDTLTLTLYWRGLQEIPDSYKVFIQSFYGDGVMVAQQDGYPVCGARGTWLWDPGDLIADVHEITVKPDAPPGLYPLYVGLYIEETLARLDLLDNAGNITGDQVHLTDIRIGQE